MSTFTLEQKKLEQIRKQLYGKQTTHAPKMTTKTESGIMTKQKLSSQDHNSPKSETYIMKDLVKVVFLSATAICLQLIIHQALVNKWIHLNFYGITY